MCTQMEEHQNSCLQSGPLGNLIEFATGGCSHIIVARYWESIDNDTMTACKADSYEDFKNANNSRCINENATFGEYVSQSAFGKFYLDYPLTKAPPCDVL
ncbi:hypothetical protein Ocin01_13122 [Orchesella cincta]|uniref:Uncharacterized protein n=1 Tax=Orchesella cincta TaxID=48709 RepID=A0A1D2ML47_ORCCI|nr:hypothetical protein Ocin01_13122 [Orchesella cincta]